MSNQQLSTPVVFSGGKGLMSHSDTFMNFGSCFAGHTQRRLQNAKCQSDANPLGIVFNPASIVRCLDLYTDKKSLGQHCEQSGIFVNADAHGDLWAESEQALQKILEQALAQGREQWQQAQHIIMTFGSALAYECIESGRVVANCHRLPASTFRQRQLTPAEVVDLLAPYIEGNTEKHFYFSVSPIRHVADGLTKNSRSKAVLLLATHILEQRYDNVHYIPAYEIIIDELRDYRFYERDMCHPSELAVDIIWQRCIAYLFDAESQEYFNAIAAIQQAAAHRVRHSQSQQHRAFCTQQLQGIAEFEQKYGARDFSMEKEHYRRKAIIT